VSLLSQLDVAVLRLFIAVVETGSISAGAARCHLSVAAASKRISDFEARLGVALLRRRSRGAVPTAAGNVFYAHAQQMAGMADVMEDDLRDHAQGVEQRLRIASNAASIAQFLPFDLASFLRVNPRVRVDLEEHTSGEIVELLQTDRVDLGLFESRHAVPGLQLHAYRDDRLVLVLPNGHPLVRRRSITFADTLDYDYAGLLLGTAIQRQMQQAAVALGRVLRIRLRVNSFDTVCRMVEGGIGLGIVPERAAEPFVKLGRLRQLPLQDAWAQRQLVLATPPQRPPSPSVQRLIEHLTQRTRRA
jgi:DNA-binding transcriptional LysR family regulator